ncbi:SH3 domain-containing protein [Chryseobacterium sp. SIMBA_038]|uniref:SH3 domain-containing protein n=1 Tax=Chryseobacterium sp. SIMBA_038 TaxID=3085780 RepID=UPI00397D886C
MKNLYLILFVLMISTSCKQNKYSNSSIKLNENKSLIDDINVENNFMFDNNEIEFKTFKYDGHYIEDLKIKDLLDKNYRNNFIKNLESLKNENDNSKSTLICQLLLMRIVQLSDSNSFYILSEISKNEIVSYNGIELYEKTLIEIFLEDPLFFIQQSTKYSDSSLIDYVIKMLQQYFINQDFLDMNLGFIKNGDNRDELLLLEPKSQLELKYAPLVKKLQTMPKVEVQLGPSFYTDFKTQESFLVNIFPILGNDLSNKLNSSEKDFYEKKIYSIISKYIIKSNIKKAFIQDPDGYTNLRKEKNAFSEILQQVKSGEKIEILDNSSDWFLVKTIEGKKGYVHKSRVKSE